MKIKIVFFILFQVSNVCLAQDKKIQVPINNPKKQFELIGKLGVKLGTVLTVKGIIVEGPFKGYQGGPNLVVQMISDSAIQNFIRIPISYLYGEFNDDENDISPKLEYGATYRFKVYETGQFVGMPPEAYKDEAITPQTTAFYFQNRLRASSWEKIDSIVWSPINFLGRNALLSGIAKNENDTAVIQSSKWKLKLIDCKKWTDAEIGKLVEVYGKIEESKSKGIYNVSNGVSRLIKLEDQLGKIVRLRGRAFDLNEDWWFNYRGTDIYVENMDKLPNWTVYNHYRPMEITGILEQAVLPSIGYGAEDHDRKLYYIVRKASWTPIEDLLTPEMKLILDDDD